MWWGPGVAAVPDPAGGEVVDVGTGRVGDIESLVGMLEGGGSGAVGGYALG